jgi:hypothetical protein
MAKPGGRKIVFMMKIKSLLLAKARAKVFERGAISKSLTSRRGAGKFSTRFENGRIQLTIGRCATFFQPSGFKVSNELTCQRHGRDQNNCRLGGG